MIPVVFEAPTGAAGKAMLQLINSVQNHHGAYVLPFDDRHETAAFHLFLDTQDIHSVQLGTANMIHQIPGNRAYTRISQEDYGGRLQETERGNQKEADGELRWGGRIRDRIRTRTITTSPEQEP